MAMQEAGLCFWILVMYLIKYAIYLIVYKHIYHMEIKESGYNYQEIAPGPIMFTGISEPEYDTQQGP